MTVTTARIEKLDLRISPQDKSLLRAAAEASRKSLSEFVLESALRRADDVLTEQTQIRLTEGDWQTFLDLLDSPPKASPRLDRLAQEPGLLD